MGFNSAFKGPLYHREKSSRYPFNRSLGSPQASESLTHRRQGLLHLPPGLALSKYKLCHPVHLINLYSHQKKTAIVSL